MRALSPTDELFLLLDRNHQPMHVAGLFVLSPTRSAPEHFARELFARFSAFTVPAPPFNERWVLTPLGYCWVRDPHFDLGNHLRLCALPLPGGRRELDAWVAQQHETRLHPDRPPWEVHIIEGLAEGRVAIYAKVHHALLDGVSGLKASLAMFSPDPDAQGVPPLWANPQSACSQGEVETHWALGGVLRELRDDVREQLSSFPTLAREAGRIARETARHLRHSWDAHAQNPFANRITSARRFGSVSLSLHRIEALAASLHGTVNDVVLALCSSALHAHLKGRGQLPDRPLMAMVPISLRGSGGGRGNRVATLLADLALDEPELSARLARVWGSVGEGKARFAKMSSEEIVGVTAMTLAPTFFSLALRARRSISQFNVVISNVPGPRSALFLDGARLCSVIPVSIVADHVGLNITFTSYGGSLHLGLVACRHAVPDMALLVAQVEEALVELERWSAQRATPAAVAESLSGTGAE